MGFCDSFFGGVGQQKFEDQLSPSWRRLELRSVADAQPAIAAFGAWWPILRLLWADPAVARVYHAAGWRYRARRLPINDDMRW